MANEQMSVDSAALGNLLLRAGIALLKAGAGSSRVVVTLRRFAAAYGCEAHIDLGTRSVSVTLLDKMQGHIFSSVRSMHELPGVNFKAIDAISRLSWTVTDSEVPLAEAALMLDKAEEMPHYPRWLVLAMVGLAGAAFCYTFGGDWEEMISAFGATVMGMAFKQEAGRRKFNPYLVTFGSALVSALVVSLVWTFGAGESFEHALATCILFLIPGAHLIHSVIDLMDGYTTNGIERGVNASMHSFAIAAGLGTVLYIFQLYR